MKRILLAVIAVLAFGDGAHAACPATLVIKDATGANYTAKYTDDGSGNCMPNVVIGGPAAVGGTSSKMLNALSNAGVAIKASAAQLLMLQCGNTNASEEYVQVFNTNAPTVGVTVPQLSIPIAPGSTGGFTLAAPGVQFTTGLAAAATTTATGNTAPAIALDCNVAYN